MRTQISALTDLLKREQASHGKDVLEHVEERERTAKQREDEAARRETAAAERIAKVAVAAAEEQRRTNEEARQQRARDQAKLDEMFARITELELLNEKERSETQRLKDDLRAVETAQQERQDKFEKMERALALVHLERERRGMEGQPTSTSAPAGRAEGATPARAHPGPRSSACSGICTPESSQPSRPWQPSRDWQKPLLSPAAERKVDMLDRLEQRPTSANLPGPPRTPGLFFGFKR